MQTAANKQNTDAPSFDMDYCCRSMLLLTFWFAPPAAIELVFCSGGRRIIFEFATALRCFAKRYVSLACGVYESSAIPNLSDSESE